MALALWPYPTQSGGSIFIDPMQKHLKGQETTSVSTPAKAFTKNQQSPSLHQLPGEAAHENTVKAYSFPELEAGTGFLIKVREVALLACFALRGGSIRFGVQPFFTVGTRNI